MAPLADNLTARLFVRYSAGGVDHVFLVRALGAVSPADVVNQARAFITALLPSLGTNVEFSGADYSAPNTNFSTPVDFGTPLVGTVVTAQVQGITVPNFVSFVGRDAAGRRARINIFGWVATQEGDYRVEAGDNVDLDAARAVLVANTTVFLSAAGLKPVWKNYYNIGRNAYWQRKQRRTGAIL